MKRGKDDMAVQGKHIMILKQEFFEEDER